MTTSPRQKAVLAYSGGLDTSVLVRILRDDYGFDVIACHVDVGEAKDPALLEAKAMKAGAAAFEFIPAQDCFAERYILPALHANALYEGVYPLNSALSRPLISEALVTAARKHGATIAAHGATGKGNDQVRFDLATRALAPDLRIVAPQREKNLSRDTCIAYALEHGIDVPVTASSPYSIDENLWGRSIEGGILEDPAQEPPEEVFAWTKGPSTVPDEPRRVRIGFAAGVPVSLDGEAMALRPLLLQIGQIAGGAGVGRIDLMESRVVGIKSREVYEAPAAIALITARKDLERFTLTSDLLRVKDGLDRLYAQVIYEGQWFSPLRSCLDGFMNEAARVVTGEVTLRLHKGSCQVVGRTSPWGVYNKALSTYGKEDKFDHRAAEGFIQLFGLQLVTYRRLHPAEGSEGEGAVIARTAATGAAALDPRFVALSSSLSRDLPLLREDILGSVAHALGLLRAGLLTPPDAGALRAGLLRILDEGAAGTLALPPEEDVHMAVEALLSQRLGGVAGRLHTGRSRNDQVAVDIQLHLREQARLWGLHLLRVLETLLEIAQANTDTVMPGYTHRQRAIPITIGHWAMAAAAGLLRDGEMLGFFLGQLDRCPLGAGALAGSSLPLDREYVADLLGFSAPTDNSLDTVGARDGASDLCYLSSRIHGHTSRIAADLVDFCSRELGFVELGDAIACGSSMMPHKRNPDVFELVRGRTAQAIGDLMAAQAMTKGLPLGYQRDLQEDRALLTGLGPHLLRTLELLALGLRNISFNKEAMSAALAEDATQATDLAEAMVSCGMPFRQAYGVVGKLIARLRDLRGSPALGAVTEQDIRGVLPDEHQGGNLIAAVMARIDPRACVVARSLTGGPAPAAVTKQIAQARERMGLLTRRIAQVTALDNLRSRLESAPL